MIRAPYVCQCSKVVKSGTRCACRAAGDLERKRRFDATRPSARERGYNSRWDKARKTFLAHHPKCEMCGAVASVVDHRIAHKGDQKLFWNSANWQALCAPCHNSRKQSIERRAASWR
ncbi:HNH endonuclease signature motif containing protein [Alsobacter sp. R-9]